MIERLSHATFYVLDQEKALSFYTEKLGFEVRTDMKMEGGFRWTTVSPKNQPDVEIILMEPVAGAMFDQESVDQLKQLVSKGKMGAGVFYTNDCHKTFKELKEKGVEFLSEPEDKFYGIEAIFRDDSGNWFSLNQRK